MAILPAAENQTAGCLAGYCCMQTTWLSLRENCEQMQAVIATVYQALQDWGMHMPYAQ